MRPAKKRPGVLAALLSLVALGAQVTVPAIHGWQSTADGPRGRPAASASASVLPALTNPQAPADADHDHAATCPVCRLLSRSGHATLAQLPATLFPSEARSLRPEGELAVKRGPALERAAPRAPPALS